MPTDPVPPWALQARQQVGRRVRHLREERELSQERLGEMAELDRKTIYRIELAQYATSVDHLAQVAHALRVPLVSLFT